MSGTAPQTSAAAIVEAARECGTARELASVGSRLPELLNALVAARATFRQVGEAMTEVTDAVTRRLLALAERELGPPPQPYSWLACGSQARREQGVVSDQDNALLLADERSATEHDGYFAALANAVVDGLAECGFARCRGGIMATNPAWRQPWSGWRAHFDGWIDRPTTHALMHSTIFFDMRVVAGAAEPLRALLDHVRDRVRGNHIFLKLMAANAVDVPPPLGLLGKVVPLRGGEHAGAVDVKKGGVMPVVDLARVHALAAGSTVVGTLDRLRDAAAARVLSAAGAEELASALEASAAIRSRHQARQLERGAEPDNFVPLRDLAAEDLRLLTDAFRVIRRHQKVLERRYA
jgi:CBS domain-containing protein